MNMQKMCKCYEGIKVRNNTQALILDKIKTQSEWIYITGYNFIKKHVY